MVAGAPCTWTNVREGFRHEIEFTDSGVFAVTVLPVDRAPVATVLVCPSLNDDLQLIYRHEAILARKLARQGVVVQRFHFRGTGNSLGDDDDMTAADLVLDAREMLGRLTTTFPSLPVALTGTRLGALVAAAIAPRSAATPLAVWDPVPDLGTYVRELRRVAAAIALTRRHSPSLDGPNGPVPDGLVATAADLTLDALGSADVGPVFVGELAASPGRDSRDDAIRALRAAADVVEVAAFPDEAAWRVDLRGPTRVDATDGWPVVDRTAEWLVDALTKQGR